MFRAWGGRQASSIVIWVVVVVVMVVVVVNYIQFQAGVWGKGGTHMETGKSAGSREVLEKGGL